MLYEKILKDIKSLKVQGANEVAFKSLDALENFVKNYNAKTTIFFIKKLNSIVDKLKKARPTESFQTNVLNYCIKNLKMKEKDNIIEEVLSRIKRIRAKLKEDELRIIELGAKKIRNGMIVFTHCHSSTVVNILKLAKKQGKKFIVHNTETRPLYQGRITAKELADAGIKVVHFVDSAARVALKDADLFLFGADSITNNGFVYNKIGTEMFCEIAEEFDVPCYSCTHSWKFDTNSEFGFDTKIEERFAKEVWNIKNKNIKIHNYAFEKVSPRLVTGIISELGIYKPYAFIDEVRKEYKF